MPIKTATLPSEEEGFKAKPSSELRDLLSGELSFTALLSTFLFVAMPVMASHIGRTILTFIDNVMVGHLPNASVAVAAVATASLAWMILFRLTLGIVTAVTTLVAQATGRGDEDEAERYAIAGMIASLIGPGLITLLIAIFAEEAFAKLNLPSDVLELTFRYFQLLAIPSVIGFSIFSLMGYYRGKGLNSIPMYFDFFGIILNLILDYGLIFGKLGMPKLGVMGAALGTGIAILARALAFVLANAMNLIRGPDLRLIYRMNLSEMFRRVKEIYKLGIPSSLEGLVMTGSQLVVIWLIAPTGALNIATYRLTLRLQGLMFVLAIGFAIANNAIIGQLKGMGREEVIRKVGWYGALISGSISLVIGSLTFLMAPLIAKLITSDVALQGALAWSIRWIIPSVIMFCIINPLAGAMKGLGDTRTPLVIIVITRLLLRLPVIYVVVRYLGGGLKHIWMIINGDNVLRLLIFSFAWERIARGDTIRENQS